VVEPFGPGRPRLTGYQILTVGRISSRGQASLSVMEGWSLKGSADHSASFSVLWNESYVPLHAYSARMELLISCCSLPTETFAPDALQINLKSTLTLTLISPRLH
jgi:hypothetical protein